MIRIIGDIHYKIPQYINILHGAEYSLQLGDLGFNYDFYNKYKIDASKHKFIKGNHDNHEDLSSPHWLGKFGMWMPYDPLELFFLGGGFSIDAKHRTPGYDWFPNEELSHEELNNAITMYDILRPKIIISHEPPFHIVPYLSNAYITKAFGFADKDIKTRTNLALEEMYSINKPKLHIFGHFHKQWSKKIDDTTFICIPECGFIDLK